MLQLRKIRNARLYENLHFDADAPVCPTNSTMESLTKARAVGMKRSDSEQNLKCMGACFVIC